MSWDLGHEANPKSPKGRSKTLPQSPGGRRTAIGEKKTVGWGTGGLRGGGGGGRRAGGWGGGRGFAPAEICFWTTPEAPTEHPSCGRRVRATTEKHLKPAVKNSATNQGLGPSKAAWKSLGPTTGVWPPADLFSRATPRAPPWTKGRKATSKKHAEAPLQRTGRQKGDQRR
jgi:hypothetical protein